MFYFRRKNPKMGGKESARKRITIRSEEILLDTKKTPNTLAEKDLYLVLSLSCLPPPHTHTLFLVALVRLQREMTANRDLVSSVHFCSRPSHWFLFQKQKPADPSCDWQSQFLVLVTKRQKVWQERCYLDSWIESSWPQAGEAIFSVLQSKANSPS